MAPVIQSYKKVLNFAPTSRAASTKLNQILTTGTDSVAAGQTGVTDSAVPTGAVIKYIEISFSVANLVNVSQFFWYTIQMVHTGQSSVAPRVVGGNAQRNQVFHQVQFMVGQSQNSNHMFRFKIPKKFQRVREGDKWQLVFESDQVFTEACQVIYKFYR